MLRCRATVLTTAARCAAWCGRVLLVLMIATGLTVGALAVPVIPASTGGGGSYPCEGGQCGCRSAEQCWTHCCCTTPAQRLAWARSHGIEPPAVVLAQVRQERAQVSCCAKPQAIPARDCCAAASHSCCAQSPAADGAADDKPPQPFSVLEAARCHGLGLWWVAGGQPLALAEARIAVPAALPAADLAVFAVFAGGGRHTPPSPPG